MGKVGVVLSNPFNGITERGFWEARVELNVATSLYVRKVSS